MFPISMHATSIFNQIGNYFMYLHTIVVLCSVFLICLPLIIGLELNENLKYPYVDVVQSVSFVQVNMFALVLPLPCLIEFAIDSIYKIKQTKIQRMNIRFIFWSIMPYFTVFLFQFASNPSSYAVYYPFVFQIHKTINLNLSVYSFNQYNNTIWTSKYCLVIVFLYTIAEVIISFGLFLDPSKIVSVLELCSTILGLIGVILLIYPSYKWFVAVYLKSNKMKHLTEIQYVGTIHLIGVWLGVLVYLCLLFFNSTKIHSIEMIYGSLIIRITNLMIFSTINNRIIRRKLAIDQVLIITSSKKDKIIIYNNL